MLNTISHGAPSSKPPLIIAHGLFGSGRNWGVIAKRLADTRQVIAVDMRNHGSSLHASDHSYVALADDLAEVITELCGGKADVLGHSMGGKAAMVLALTHAKLVGKLTVADIAPVAYKHSQQHNIDIMKGLDLSQIKARSDAQTALLPLVEDPTLASFFTQSLDVKEKRWRLNLDALEANMDNILGFPALPEGSAFSGPTLFLSGGQSDYVRPEHRDQIKSLFPAARFAKIPGAGHWLHAEKPREFEAAVRMWLDQA